MKHMKSDNENNKQPENWAKNMSTLCDTKPCAASTAIWSRCPQLKAPALCVLPVDQCEKPSVVRGIQIIIIK